MQESRLVKIDDLKKDSLDTSLLLQFPDPMKGSRGVCLVTEDIPLQLLYSAYIQGVFPWFSEEDGEPVLWCSPSPRFCIRMENLHIGRSIDRFLKKSPYRYTMDKAFSRVIEECSRMKRRGQRGTWIGSKMIEAYNLFHEAGFAHSVEVWHGENLVGGFYGVLIGSVYCGESMFTLESDSSKSAFALFARCFRDCGGLLIDSQSYTDNIARYGAENISRTAFLRLEGEALRLPLAKNLREQFESAVSGYPVQNPLTGDVHTGSQDLRTL